MIDEVVRRVNIDFDIEVSYLKALIIMNTFYKN